MARSHGRSSAATQGRGERFTVALSVLVFAGASAVAAQTDDSSPSPSASLLPLVDTVADELLELSITTPKDTWAVGPIEVSATLAYVGTEPEIVVTGGVGLVGFGIEQLDGPIDQSPVWRLPCNRFPFATGEVQTFPYKKSGSFGASDPMASFWERWFDDPQLRPPAGTYRLYAEARYGWPECGDETTLTASVTVEVVGTSVSPLTTSAAGAPQRTSTGQLADDLPPVIDDENAAIALIAIGDDPDVVVKLVEQFYGRGWPAARQVAENAPIIMLEGLSLDAAEELMSQFRLMPGSYAITDARAAVASGVVAPLPFDPSVPSADGWSATPTEPDPAFVEAGIALCLEGLDLYPDELRDAPVVHDQRGPAGAALLFVGEEGQSDCLMYRLESGDYAVWGASWAGDYAEDDDGLEPLSLDLVAEIGGAPTKVFGPVADEVAAVEVSTESGRIVKATVAQGWFIAWWPGVDGLATIRAYGRDGALLTESERP